MSSLTDLYAATMTVSQSVNAVASAITASASPQFLAGTFTVSNLNTRYPPSTTAPGTIAVVSDASSPTWHSTLAGGGSTFSLALNTGANWIAG
jgi:hypothetical protein